MPPYEELLLLQNIANGDKPAFNKLYEQYWPKVFGYLDNIVKCPEVAEELMVDIFVKIWSGKEGLVHVNNIGGFLRTTARNKALDFLRTNSTENRRIGNFKTNMLLQATQQPEDRIINAEMQKILREAITQLSPQRKRIFLLHREQDLSYQEIATQLGISPGTVKKTMSQALDSIREFLRTNYSDVLSTP